MTTRRRPGGRTFTPAPEGLEERKLLAKVATGVDPAGDVWTLQLVGPGDLRVINQPDSKGNIVPLGQPAWINEIDLAGTSPTSSKLVGTVKKAPGSDGRVFFENPQDRRHAHRRAQRHLQRPRYRHARFLAGPHVHRQTRCGSEQSDRFHHT